MKTLLAWLKFIASGVLMISILFEIFSTLNQSGEIYITIIVDISLVLIAAPFCYYLIKTGIWNLNNKTYSLNTFLLIGLAFHFIIAILLLIYSQYIFPSKEVSKQLLFTTVPFCLVGFVIAFYDAKQFFISWKKQQL